MQNCGNKELQKFLEKLVDELKFKTESYDYYNKAPLLDKFQIPFIVSSLWQSFRSEPNTYQNFISDLSQYSDYQINIIKPSNDYYGICDIQIFLIDLIDSNYDSDLDEPDYSYLIQIFNDERNWEYCECQPNDPDYREDKHCCGHGCDWSAPAFSLHKVVDINKHIWSGDEHDFWDFEDEFYKSEMELNEEKIKEDRESEIKRLQDLIKESQERLDELNGK